MERASPETALRLIEQKMEEARHTAGLGMTSFNMFIVVNGGLLYGTTGSSETLVVGIGVIGFIFAGVYGMACAFLIELSTGIRDEVAALNTLVGEPLSGRQAKPLNRIGLTGAVFASFVGIGWIAFLLIR